MSTEETCSLYGVPSEQENDEICAALPSISFYKGALVGVRIEDALRVWSLVGSSRLRLEVSHDGQSWQWAATADISKFYFWRIRAMTP